MIVARHEMPGIGLTGTRPVGHGVNSVSRSSIGQRSQNFQDTTNRWAQVAIGGTRTRSLRSQRPSTNPLLSAFHIETGLTYQLAQVIRQVRRREKALLAKQFRVLSVKQFQFG